MNPKIKMSQYVTFSNTLKVDIADIKCFAVLKNIINTVIMPYICII